MGVLTNTLYANFLTKNLDNFITSLTKAKKGKVLKTFSNITSKNTKLINVNKKINIPNLSPMIKQDPKKLLIVSKANNIINKGKFEKNFFLNQNFNNQLSIISQASRYGTKYFDTAKKISNIDIRILKNSQRLLKYIPKNISQARLQEKFISTLNKTGKYGWERLKDIGIIIKSHPKKSILAGAYLWYVVDPDSFEQELQHSGKTLTQFLLSLSGDIINGAGEAVVEKANEIKKEIVNDVKNKINNAMDMPSNSSYIITNVTGIIFLVLLFIIWKKRLIIKDFLLRADSIKENRSKNKFDDKYNKDDNEF